MSGLLAALLLRRAAWDVDVFERVESELAGRGAGIVAQTESDRDAAAGWESMRPISGSRSRNARSSIRPAG